MMNIGDWTNLKLKNLMIEVSLLMFCFGVVCGLLLANKVTNVD